MGGQNAAISQRGRCFQTLTKNIEQEKQPQAYVTGALVVHGSSRPNR
jgi:hypothetical protein